MREVFLKYMWMAAWEHIPNKEGDLEGGMKEIGYDMGKLLIILRGFQPESSVEALLFKIAYNLLPALYESERYIEKCTDEKNAFLLSELTPLMNSHVSLPEEHSTFSCDAIIAGVIESILAASGFTSEVTAHNAGTAASPDRVVYLIKMRVGEERAVEEGD